MRIGVQIHPEHTSMEQMRAAARHADGLGVDSIWTWDHFFPLTGDPGGTHFEGWTTLTAFACDTTRARLGVLVTCSAYRNPDLLADMARTVDHIAGGRVILGIGAGWFERDHDEYGYPFPPPAERAGALEESLRRIRARRRRLNPPPAGSLPILVGGGGERVMLRLVAEYAEKWNWFGPPDRYAHKNAVLDRWCRELRRDPGDIERTVLVPLDEGPGSVAHYARAGAEHVIVRLRHPFELDAVQPFLEAAR